MVLHFYVCRKCLIILIIEIFILTVGCSYMVSSIRSYDFGTVEYQEIVSRQKKVPINCCIVGILSDHSTLIQQNHKFPLF